MSIGTYHVAHVCLCKECRGKLWDSSDASWDEHLHQVAPQGLIIDVPTREIPDDKVNLGQSQRDWCISLLADRLRRWIEARPEGENLAAELVAYFRDKEERVAPLGSHETELWNELWANDNRRLEAIVKKWLVKRTEPAGTEAARRVVDKVLGRPRIVCLCGSTRFIDHIAIEAWELEKKGWLTLGPHLLPQSYCTVPDHQAEADGVKEDLDELHLRKIELADEVLVINVGGYIGDSTRKTIAHAEELGKPVRYLEPVV